MKKEYLHLINKYKQKFLGEKFKALSITFPETFYLQKLLIHGKIKMSQLTQNIPFHKSHATRSITKLEKANLIEKVIDPEDQRGFIISLTNLGIEMAKRVIQIKDEWDNLLLSSLDDTEIAMLSNLQEKILLFLKAYFLEEEND